MSNYIEARPSTDDLVLIINGEDQASWNLRATTKKIDGYTDVFIHSSIVDQIIQETYQAGYNKGGKQLSQVKALLKD